MLLKTKFLHVLGGIFGLKKMYECAVCVRACVRACDRARARASNDLSS